MDDQRDYIDERYTRAEVEAEGAAELAEAREYQMGRRAGLTDALLFLWKLVDDLPRDEHRLIVDKAVDPLHRYARGEQS